MPYINITEALLSPMLADAFTVVRRSAYVNDKGRSVVSAQNIAVRGVVNSAGPNDLVRVPEEQHMGRVLSIVSKFPLRGPAPGFQPDVILWHGDTFVVIVVDPYPQYGPGFSQAIVSSTDSIDTAQLAHAPDVARCVFTQAPQSALAGVI